jgi:hypothetical protein
VTHFTAETRKRDNLLKPRVHSMAKFPDTTSPINPREQGDEKGKKRAAKIACGPSLTVVLEWA